MPVQAKIIGVHPVEAEETVHLVELLIEGDVDDFEFGEITQKIDGQPKSNWQVPYEEQIVDESKGKAHYAFFFHYLDFKKPLLTPTGPIILPEPTKIPARLQNIVYEPPS